MLLFQMHGRLAIFVLKPEESFLGWELLAP